MEGILNTANGTVGTESVIRSCATPHLNHHVLCSPGLFTIAEADIETSRWLHLLHQHLYQLSRAKARWLFEALTPQDIQGHYRATMHLHGRVDLRQLQAIIQYKLYTAMLLKMLQHFKKLLPVFRVNENQNFTQGTLTKIHWHLLIKRSPNDLYLSSSYICFLKNNKEVK